ncbi:MAG: hypothetical protein ACRBCK_04695 [Alphaproteobacteria bacterium]
MPILFSPFENVHSNFSSYKDQQNYIVGVNLARKSSQLTSELAILSNRDRTLDDLIVETSSNIVISDFDQLINDSIEEIRNIRDRLGISQPAGDHIKSLEDLLKPKNGSLINTIL